MSWKGVITNAGKALIDQWELGGHTFTIDKATVGDGTTVEANMRVATALAHELANVQIAKMDAVDGGARFQIQIPATSGTSYTAKEVGLWGHLDSGAATLIALHQDAEAGIVIPTTSAMPDFVFTLFLVHAIGNTSQLTVNVDTSALLTKRAMDEALDSLWATGTEVVEVIDDALSDTGTGTVHGGGSESSGGSGASGESGYTDGDIATDEEVNDLIDGLFAD